MWSTIVIIKGKISVKVSLDFSSVAAMYVMVFAQHVLFTKFVISDWAI